MKTIKLGEIGDYSEEQVNALLSVVILTADRIVKEGLSRLNEGMTIKPINK